MKKIKIVLLSMLLIFVVASCSKEKRIENSLHKKGGEWTVKSFYIDNYVNGSYSDKDVYGNQGKMTFSENGTMIWRWDEDGYISDNACSWSNSKDKLTIIWDGEVIIFDISNRKKKSMDLKAEVLSYSSFNGQNYTYREVYNMTIEKL